MSDRGRIGYAAVGLGWITQAALLPAFANARRNSKLVALVSGDDDKRQRLGERYGVDAEQRFHYDDFDECLSADAVDAVYIGLPNHLHREYAVRAAEAGVHVLCEKPMAVTERECRDMIDAARQNDVRLMIAYRLHFDPANLRVVELAAADRIGEPRVFSSVFSQVLDDPDDIRLNEAEKGGGSLYDIGIYCLNAARYLFRAEPERVWATAATPSRDEERFGRVPEMASCVLRFPGDRLAQFTCSFGAAAVSEYRLVGTEGSVRLVEGYQFRGERVLEYDNDDGDRARETFEDGDQFGPQLIHFSDRVIAGAEPGPSGEEGRLDVRVIEALRRSMERGTWIDLEPSATDYRPRPEQAMHCPPVDEPELVGETPAT